MSRIALGLIAASLASCASPQTRSSHINAQGAVQKYVSVCQIRTSPSSYVGKVVRIRGVYKTDTMFYASLDSPECQETPRAIDVSHPVHTKGDSSVTSFFAHERSGSGCGNQSVCPVAFAIDVGVLVKQTAGELEVEFQHVYSAKLRP